MASKEVFVVVPLWAVKLIPVNAALCSMIGNEWRPITFYDEGTMVDPLFTIRDYVDGLQSDRPFPALDRPLGPRAVEFFPDQSVVVKAEAPQDGKPYVALLGIDSGAVDYRFNFAPRIARLIADMLNVEADTVDPSGERLVPMYRPSSSGLTDFFTAAEWRDAVYVKKGGNPVLPDTVSVEIVGVQVKADVATITVKHASGATGSFDVADSYMAQHYLTTLMSGDIDAKNYTVPTDSVSWFGKPPTVEQTQ